MLSRNQEGSPRNSRPATPPSGRPESIEIQGCTMPWLKQATRRMLGHPPKSRDRTVINALAAVQRGPAGIFFPGDYGDATSNSSAHTQKAFLKQAQTTFFFTHNVAAPTLWVALPPLRARFESTSQLGHCSDLLRRYLTTTTSTAIIVTPLDPVQQDLVQAFVQDKEEQSRVFGLVRKVVEEFVVDALKSSASISEVVLLGPGLDRDDYHKLLNSLIAEFKSATLLNIEPLRGLVHMIECAKPGCLVADDLVRILAILRTRLQYTHQQSTKHPYYLVLAISRLLDVMVEGKVKDLSRVTEYEPLSTLLTELSAHPDMRLKHQATYALQGLFHIPNDETRRGFVLRHAGNIAMGLLGVASVCRLDMSKVGEGAGQLGRCAADLHDIATKATEGGRSLHASGQDIMTSIRGGIFSGGQQLWYPALREAQEHIRNGRLADFNSLVFEAPCRRDAEFQWGICQLLGEIAIDPLLDIVVRQNAIDFLAQLYRDDTVSNPDKDIWTYILDLLRQIDDPPDSPVSSHARSQLQGLAMEGGTDKQIVYRDIMAGPFDIFPLKVRLSSPFSSLLLDRAQAIPEVDHTLSKLRDMRLKESTNDLYIPPQAKPTSRSGNDRLFPLMRNTLDFLASDCQVLLLLGDSGGGKSTFNLQLENTLWQSYKRDAPIPLHINLPTIDNPDQNMIAKRLQQLDFSEAQIQELKQQRQFIVICDGYDESQLNRNLYTTNQFNQAGQWSVKMVIACRIQYLGPDYRSRFQPNAERYQHQQQQQAADHFQESFIAPFSDDQIKEYVEQFVAKDTTVPDQQKWSAHDYMDKLLKINGLMELVSNPFLLSLTLRALPKVVQSAKDISKIRLTRVSLYDNFMEQWLEINKRRLQDSPLSSEARAAFDALCEVDFIQQGINYQKDLARAIFQHQKGKPVVDYAQLRGGHSWKAEFFGRDMQVTLLRESSPLTRSGTQYRFLHRSLLEYLYSRLISDPFNLGDNPTDDDPEATNPCNTLANHPLNQRNIVGERSILQFLAERVDSKQSFKTFLLDVVEASKKDGGIGKAAANAMSILVKAGVRFDGADLSGVSIPGADLRYGQFNCTDLRGADLTGVNLSKAWLRRADLSCSLMGGVEFGELPHLQLDSGIKNCVFSLDGKLLFVCSHQCIINVYDTTTWELKYDFVGKPAIAISPNCKEFANATLNNDAEVVNIESGEGVLILSGHEDFIESICYSPDGNLIATGSKDKIVRIWRPADYETGETADALRVLYGHEHTITGVAFSPSGLQFASCSMDKTIRITNVETWMLIDVLYCVAPVLALAYSPDGQQLASCGQDADLRLWNTNSDNTDHLLLKGHVGAVFAAAFSPDGRRVASCGESGVIYFWNPRNGVFLDVLSGDRYEVNSVAFSPANNLLVSGGNDNKVQLWKVGDVSTSDTLNNGHSGSVKCVDISTDGEWIVTGCKEGAVQLWETFTGKPGAILEGHESDIIEVAFSPSGKQVASSCVDLTVCRWCVLTGQSLCVIRGQAVFGKGLAFAPDGTRLATSYENETSIQLWDTQSGDMVATLQGHRDKIVGTVYSPSGDQIASWSDDKTVRLWSTHTNKCVYTFDQLEVVLDVVYSPDGQHIISTAADGSGRWDTQSGEHLELFWRSIDPVIFWCSYSPDGKYLATVEVEKNRFHLWDISTADQDQGGDEIFSTGIGRSLQHVWRRCSNGKMVLASIDTNFSLRVRELTANDVQLMWSVGVTALSLKDAIIDNIVNLSDANLLFMKQRADDIDNMEEWSEATTERHLKRRGER